MLRTLLALLWSFGLASGGWRASQGPSRTFLVTTSGDPPPSSCTLQRCSLREAVLAANSSPGLDEITLPPGVYFLSRPGVDEDFGNTGDLDIRESVVIHGAGAGVTIIDAANLDRAIDLIDYSGFGMEVAIDQVSIRGGLVVDEPGGGIRVGAGVVLTLTQGVIAENQAVDGGGLYVAPSASLALGHSSVVNNRADRGGGAANWGTLAARTSTIANNTANVEGGGIDNHGQLDMFSVTLAGNHAMNGAGVAQGGKALIANTLLGLNITGAGFSDCSGVLTSQGYNLIANMAGCSLEGVATGNQLGVQPVLGKLGDFGGGALTVPLLPGSPAIDAADPADPGSGEGACTLTDQRGVPRTWDGDNDGIPRCDIGSFEFLPLVYLPVVTR